MENINIDEMLKINFDDSNSDETILDFFKILYKLDFHCARTIKKDFGLNNLNKSCIMRMESDDKEELFIELHTSILKKISNEEKNHL